MEKIELSLQYGVDFSRARELATKKATELFIKPKLLSWFDATKDRRPPNVDSSSDSIVPDWVVYGELKGGSLRIDVDGAYCFIFGEASSKNGKTSNGSETSEKDVAPKRKKASKDQEHPKKPARKKTGGKPPPIPRKQTSRKPKKNTEPKGASARTKRE